MSRKPVQPITFLAAEQRAFGLFYDTYAPKLWGCILRANLPTLQAETILTNTFRCAWQQLEKPVSVAKVPLAQLLRLAHQQGLPLEALRTNWTRTLYPERDWGKSLQETKRSS